MMHYVLHRLHLRSYRLLSSSHILNLVMRPSTCASDRWLMTATLLLNNLLVFCSLSRFNNFNRLLLLIVSVVLLRGFILHQGWHLIAEDLRLLLMALLCLRSSTLDSYILWWLLKIWRQEMNLGRYDYHRLRLFRLRRRNHIDCLSRVRLFDLNGLLHIFCFLLLAIVFLVSENCQHHGSFKLQGSEVTFALTLILFLIIILY